MAEERTAGGTTPLRPLRAGWLLVVLVLLELVVMGSLGCRYIDLIALEVRAVGGGSDGTLAMLHRLVISVWLPCNFVDVAVVAAVRATLLGGCSAPARVHTQFYSLGVLYTTTAVYLLLKFSRLSSTPVQHPWPPVVVDAAACQVHMLRVTVALSVFSLLVGWLQILVAHRRRERLLLQSMYSQWLAAHPHAAPLQPRVLEWLRRPAEDSPRTNGMTADGYEVLEPSPPMSHTGSFTSAMSSHPHNHVTAPPVLSPHTHEEDDGKDDIAAVARALEFVTEAVTAAELEAIVALSQRTRAAKLPLPQNDRYFTLLRFVRARDCNVAKAEDMLRAMLRWKQTLGVERLYAEGFDFPEEAAVLKVYPHGYHRTDRLGRPVFIMLLGHIDPVQLERITTIERLEKNHVYEWEKLLAVKFPACTAAAGRRIYNSCTIFDLQGISLYQFHQARHMLQRVTQLDQDYYPEYLGELILVNTPWLFKGIWAVILPWLGRRTQRKITMLGTDYQAELHKRIHPEKLPHFLGGSCRCDRNGGGCLGQPWVGPWTRDYESPPDSPQ